MTPRMIVAPILLALVAAALVAPSTGSAAGATCVAGTTTVSGKKATRFCGPAKAAATVGTKTFTFSGGVCQKSGSYFTINIGTLVHSAVANAKPGPLKYFGVTVTPADSGVHLTQAITWNSGGTRYAVAENQITLKRGLLSGSFKGKDISTGKKIKGTFSC